MMKNVKDVSLNIARDDKKKIDRLSLKLLFNFTRFRYEHLLLQFLLLRRKDIIGIITITT